jgi:type IV pilus assembly protein PilO
MEFSLAKLPWYVQVGAFSAIAVAGGGAFFYWYDMPKRAEMATRQKTLTGLRADIQKGQSAAKQLPQIRAELADLENRLANLRAVLPEEKDAADLLRRMQTEATQSNLTIKSFKPAPVVTKQLHAEWPIALELEGTYHNLAIFFDRIGKFTRIVNITALDVKAKDKPEPAATITAIATATTFVLLDKPPAPAKPGAKPGAKPAPGTKPAA